MPIPQSFQQWQQVADPLHTGYRNHTFNLNVGGMMLFAGWFYPYAPGVMELPPQSLGGGYWRLRWLSNRLPPVTFYVWLNGSLATTTQQYEHVVHVPQGGSLEYFIFDSQDARPPEYFPSSLYIYWPAAPEAASYRVEQLIGEAWLPAHERVESNQASYEWITPPLEDVSNYQFRVVAVGRNENETVLDTTNVLMVRRPNRHAATWSYDDETRQVTISIDA